MRLDQPPRKMETMQQSTRYFRSSVTCTPWSESEISLLHEIAPMFRGNWERASRLYFPSRSANQLKCKYNYLARRARREGNKQEAKVQSRSQEIETPACLEDDWPLDWFDLQ